MTEAGAKAHAQKRVMYMLRIMVSIFALITFLQIYTASPEERGVVIGASIFTSFIFIGIVFLVRKTLQIFLQQIVVSVDEKHLMYEVTKLEGKHNIFIRYMYAQLSVQSGGYKQLAWEELDATKDTNLYLLVKGVHSSAFTGKDTIFIPYEMEKFDALQAIITKHLN